MKVGIDTGESVQDIITRVANELGVDPKLALAIAQQESGLNPDAIGDNGHSVGLFQLYDQGEGAGMSVAQREDPETNARIALTEVAAVASAHPNWSPGEIAAAAQRPADRAGYAKSVNAIYGGPITGGTYTGSSTGASAGVDTPNTQTAAPQLPKESMESRLMQVNDVVGGGGTATGGTTDSLEGRLSALNDIFSQAGFQLKGPQ